MDQAKRDVGAGPIGPTVGEIVKTDYWESLGEVVSVDYQNERFTVEWDDAKRVKTTFNIGEYETRIMGAWHCGHGNERISCIYRNGHHGPHVYKTR